ncbi:MAG: transporter ATP-binding protein, partial [Deltaproteobacteria bacterium]|nr:transporter ATP-binding protein [Deltaproteobacteria bacterium]
EIVARLNNDMVEVQGILVDVPMAFVTSSVRLVVASAILVAMSWSLFLVSNVLVPLGVLGLWLTRNVITGMSRELREKNAAVGTRIIDTFAGIRLVRSSATECEELRKFEQENLSLVRSVLRFQTIFSLSRGIPSFVWCAPYSGSRRSSPCPAGSPRSCWGAPPRSPSSTAARWSGTA